MWDQRYSDKVFVYGKKPNDFLKAEFSRIPFGGKVLCLAEGEGRNAVFLAQQGFDVTAVDQSAVGLRKAQQLAADNAVKITTVVADLADYDLGQEAWDGIVSISAHTPAAIRENLHLQVVTALKKGGVFILEAYTERQLEMDSVGGPPDTQRAMFMSLDELQLELNGLDMVLGVEIERNISEGTFHQGDSAVVEVVAYKMN